MKTKFKTVICFVLTIIILSPKISLAQCGLSLNISTTESRCKATGSLTINVTGGSGNYNYRLSKGSFSTLTSSNIINGLQAGTYLLEVKDLANNCIATNSNVVISGNYEDPRFQLLVTDISCTGASDGAVSVTNVQYGRGPFNYSIVAPSASGVGISNSTGVFTGLIPGDYYIRLTDSCGGIQTRTVRVADYTWQIDSKTISKIGCDSADASVVLRDSKGNLNTSGTIFNGYSYGVSRSPGDTSWYSSRNFRFFKGTLRNVTILARDLCGNIRSSIWNDTQIPVVSANVSLGSLVCAGFTATVTGQSNLTSPQYCLYNSSNVLISCNTNGVFTNIPYGNYCINIRDFCYDTVISRCFNVSSPVPSVGSTVTTNNLQCNSFDASITGQQNLTSPQYCLFNSLNVQIACNSTGVFTNIPYGSYCIQVTDGCSGTVINRCFTRNRPVPAVSSSVSITNRACSTFTAGIGGQVNISNGQYCIYDGNGVLIACNTTGIFDNLHYGTYCINVINNTACYDTVITRCITINRLLPSVSNTVALSNQNCSTFNASIAGQQNLNNPQYCLYDNLNNLVTCNTTGIFNSLAYGSYCIRVANDAACYDTTITRCFTATRPIPSVGSTVAFSNRNCTSFTATVTNQTNLTNPQFCLVNSANVEVECNNSGVFNNVPYGNYCIYIRNTCYDTVITRCFFERPAPMVPTVNAVASCTIGASDFNVNWLDTESPYNVRVYNPMGAIVRDLTVSNSSTSITGLPSLPFSWQYKIVITDDCGNKDSVYSVTNASWLNKSISANSKCPSGQWQNGSGDLTVFCQYSNGSVIPRITQKNFAPVNISYNFNTGFNYSFNTMEPATYVIEYTLQNCSAKVYDTFNLEQYAFPNLGQSGVYVCNNSSFGVNAAVSGGVAPFTYEIIGSLPSTPSIVSAPQNSPSFNLNNGASYSVVRLRAIDACGNATINDASIMPLANTLISSSSNCFYNNITMNVDTVPNATYTWYKRINGNDSVLLTTDQSYNIPYMLPTDTGTYICKVSVNAGCLTRIAYFNLTGSCGGHLLSSNEFSLRGSNTGTAIQLQWTTDRTFDATNFIIERSQNGNSFQTIGSVKPVSARSTQFNNYLFSDNDPLTGKNLYRVRIVRKNGEQTLSKTLSFENILEGVQIFPNPVETQFKVRFNGLRQGTYTVNIITMEGKQVYSEKLVIRSNMEKNFERPAGIPQGTYLLVVQPLDGRDKTISKIIFR